MPAAIENVDPDGLALARLSHTGSGAAVARRAFRAVLCRSHARPLPPGGARGGRGWRQAEASVRFTRRTETVTLAPILRSFWRIVPQVAFESCVPASPMRRSAHTST